MTVDNRCAMAIVVRPLRSSVMACCMSLSDRVSRELVASSRSSILGSASMTLAMASLCLSPPDSRYPCSPTTVSYPSGIALIVSCICAALAASIIS